MILIRVYNVLDYKAASELCPSDKKLKETIRNLERKIEEDTKKKTEEVLGSLKKMGEGILSKYSFK